MALGGMMGPGMKRISLGLGFLLAALPLGAQVSESPTTVERGQWLVEADLYAVAFDRHTYQRDGVHYRSTYVGSWLLSTGVAAKVDVQCGLETWREERASGDGWSERGRGVGDAWLRAKWNFAGDEESGPAWALLPYVKLPLADRDIGNGRGEPGCALVYGRPLRNDRWCNGTLGVDWLDDGGGGRSLGYYGSLALTWPCGQVCSAYAEAVAWVNAEATREWSGELGLGLTRDFGRGIFLDLAVYVGVTRAAPDVTPVLRIIWPL